MLNGKERIKLPSNDNPIQTAFSCAQFAFEAGTTHFASQRRLRKEGVIWYPVGSIFLPFFNTLSGKRFPEELHPLISGLWEYARQTDDLFDESKVFPNLQDTKSATAFTQKALTGRIHESDLPQNKKRALLRELGELRKRAYDAFAIQKSWQGPVSFGEAFAYRMNSSILLMRKIAAMGNVIVDTIPGKRAQVENAFEAIGVPLQIIDDLQDVEEDARTDGNLVHAALYDHGEGDVFFTTLRNASDGTNLFHTLQTSAPDTAQFLTEEIRNAIIRIEEISPHVARPVRMCTQVCFDRMSVSREKKDLLHKFANEVHRRTSPPVV